MSDDELVVPAGETETISAGSVARYSTIDVDGTLQINGTLEAPGWRLDGKDIGFVEDLSIGPESVSVTWSVDRSAIETWREYDRAGDFGVESGFAGQYQVQDNGGRSSPVDLDPPSWHTPPLTTVRGYVSSYSEDQVAPDRVQVSITVQRITPRTPAYPAVDQSGPWELVLSRGAIALDDMSVAPTPADGSTAGRTLTVTVRLDDAQAATLLDTAARPGAVVERTIQGGRNRRVDETPAGDQTADIVTPQGAVQATARAYVTGWSLEHAGYVADRRWRAEIKLAEDIRLLLVRDGETRTLADGVAVGGSRIERGGVLDQPRNTTLQTTRD